MPASTGRDSRTSYSRKPQGGAHRPLHREKQGKLTSAGFQKAPARFHGLSPCGWVGAPGGATEGAEEMSGGEPPSGAPGQPLAALQGLAAGGETEAQGTQAPTTRTSCPRGRSRAPTDARDPLGRECPHSSTLGAHAGNARCDRAGSNPQPHGTGQSPTPAPPTPGVSQRSLRGLRTQPALLHSCSLHCLRQRPRSDTTACRETRQPPGEVNTDTEGRPSRRRASCRCKRTRKKAHSLG